MRKLSFFQKIVLTSAVSILLTVLVLSNLYFNTEKMKKFQLDSQASQSTISKLNTLNMLMVDMETGVRGFMLSGDPEYLEPYNRAEVEFEEYIRKAKESGLQLERINKIHELKKRWIEEAALGEMMARRKLNAKRISLDEFTNFFKASKGKEITDLIRKEVNQGIAIEEKKIFSGHMAKQVTIASVVVVLVIVVSFFAIIAISKLIFKQMSFLINDLDEVAHLVKDTSNGLANISNQLDQSTKEQAKSLETTSSSLYQISQMAKASSENAQSSAQAVITCNELAQHGKASVDEIIASVNEISRVNEDFMMEIEENNKKICDIVKIILEIGNKTKVINDIVFQTKLLSFNASVEAARAGENGRGFSIVAGEIGKLASISGQAAQEISDLLLKSQNEVQQILDMTRNRISFLVDNGKMTLDKSKEVIKRTEASIDNVVVEVAKISKMLREISHAIVEQDSSIDTIKTDMNGINAAAVGTSQISVETQNSAEILLRQSHKLTQSISSLKHNIYGKAL